MVIKQRVYHSQKLDRQGILQIATSVLNKGKSAVPSLFINPEVLCSVSDKTKLLAKNISKNFYLDDSDIPLPAFPSVFCLICGIKNVCI